LKYLIVGLGNIGEKYKYTRHNIGFLIIDKLANNFNLTFNSNKISYYAYFKLEEKNVFLIKPKTFMNLSGLAVDYWLKRESISLNNILVICDDYSLSFGTIRLRSKGQNAGHKGLESIDKLLNSNNYPRLRIGIKNDELINNLADFVLSEFNNQEKEKLPIIIDTAIKSILCFLIYGIDKAMNLYNKKIF